MPYIKPLELLRLQQTAAHAVTDYKAPVDVHVGKLKESILLCPVCGESGCTEEVFNINDYLFHASDIEEREKVNDFSI